MSNGYLNIINETETTILVKKEEYDKHCRKVNKLIKNNRRMKNKIKTLKKEVSSCQKANHKYKQDVEYLTSLFKE